MATFKIQQRVRLVSHVCNDGCWSKDAPPIGAEGCIVRVGHVLNSYRFEWVVDFPLHPTNPAGHDEALRPSEYLMDSSMLAPLTDPKADEFIERIKKLKPEPVAPALPTPARAN